MLFFIFSEAEPKGTDCLQKFMEMNECMKTYPELYPESAAEDPDEEPGEEELENNASENSDNKQLAEENSWKYHSTIKYYANSNIKTIFHPCLKRPSNVEIGRKLKTGTMNYIAVWFFFMVCN